MDKICVVMDEKFGIAVKTEKMKLTRNITFPHVNIYSHAPLAPLQKNIHAAN